ncbi:hypothetical protein [Magnetospirillum aberrantis]|uniref:Uncharacterized protein n=1 Tax=Magnetospirillum aberrantis SpK TaxID=908842 RepID=A0A7C9QVB0_9PROT|nr:hypothetical protein [Magnetospirillum aberrantis]NFV81297.1 hypothetical protein [Magnetospirillum aberrantis SpK]
MTAGSVIRPESPQTAIVVDVGVGKTHEIVNTIPTLARQGARIAYATANHKIAAEVVARINEVAGERLAVVWRGPEQEDPACPGGKMCPRADALAAVLGVTHDREGLCGSKRREGGFCRYNPAVAGEDGCGYLRQREQVRGAPVVVFPVNMLAEAVPMSMRRPKVPLPDGSEAEQPAFDMLVIDEAFHTALLGGFGAKPYAVPLEDLAPELWNPPDRPDADGDRPGWAKRELHEVFGALGAAITSASNGRVPDGPFRTAGLTGSRLQRAFNLARRCYPGDAEVRKLYRPDMAADQIAAALADAAKTTGRVRRVTRLLEIAADLLDGRTTAAAIQRRQHGASVSVALKWRKPIHAGWDAATVYLDATGTPELTRAWLPRLNVAPAVTAAKPYQRIVQVVDKTFSQTSLIDDESKPPEDKHRKTALNNQAKVAQFVEVVAATHHGRGVVLPDGQRVDVLLIGQLALVGDPEKGAKGRLSGRLPGNLAVAHLNGMRGLDRYKGVSALVIVGRTQASPGEVEDLAEIITGTPVARLSSGEWYSTRTGGRLLADGSGLSAEVDHHPDRLAEMVRRSICEAEILQAIGRGRGVRRGADHPLTIYLLTDVVIPEPVEVVTWEEAQRIAGPPGLLFARGVVPLDGRGRAAVLADVFGPGAKGHQACKDWLRHHQEDAATLDKWANGELVEFSYSTSLLEFSTKSREGWAAFKYRRGGERQSASVWIDTRQHPDPRAAAERWLGQLDRWEAAPIPMPVPEAKPAEQPVPPPKPQAAPVEQQPATFTLEQIAAALGYSDWLQREARKGRLKGLPEAMRDALGIHLLQQEAGVPAFIAACNRLIAGAGTGRAAP